MLLIYRFFLKFAKNGLWGPEELRFDQDRTSSFFSSFPPPSPPVCQLLGAVIGVGRGEGEGEGEGKGGRGRKETDRHGICLCVGGFEVEGETGGGGGGGGKGRRVS